MHGQRHPAQTGLKVTAQTDSRGLFIFPSLPAGTYDVIAEAQGFRASQKSAVDLDAASRRTVDFTLEVGSSPRSSRCRPPPARWTVLSVSYVYEIPFFRQHANKALRGILGGWDLSGVTIYQRGAPFSVTVPVDIARIRVTSSRATLVGDPSLPAGERTPVLHEPQHRGALRQQRAAHRWVWGGDGGRAGRTLEFGARLTF